MGRTDDADAPERSTAVQVQNIERYRDDSENDADVSSQDQIQPSHEFEREPPVWYKRSYVPTKIRTIFRKVTNWLKGPLPPHRYIITPVFPKIQHAPLQLLDKIAPKTIHKAIALIVFCALWLLCFGLVLWSSNAAGEVQGYGSPVILACTSTFWSDGDGCGLNGDFCRPFANSTMAFRCPANCAGTQVLNPHAVGDQELVYQSLTVGGPAKYQTGYEGVIEKDAVYRGDSFICSAAIHAGFISNTQGGCGVTTLTGQQPDFEASNSHGVQSVGFDSYFPLSFGFASGTQTECKDLRLPAMIASILFSMTLGVFTEHAAVFFWTIFTALFFTVALATDPPFSTTFYGLLSTAVGRFLPAAFCIGIMYRFFIRRSLLGLTAQMEKTILWVGACWVGALNNYTFDQIPIQRLTPHDIQAQPGAIPALIIIIIVLIVVAIGQAWAFRKEGRMPRYLGLYGLMALGLLIMLALPGENLRIHHYILALLLIPGTSFQNRPSLLYQGLLVGLFINGVARWGFDSIIQTPAALFGGAQQGSLLPNISVQTTSISNITFSLGTLPIYDMDLGQLYEGISVLVNDVERFRGYNDDRVYWSTNASSSNLTWTWNRHDYETSANSTLPEYFRFAYLAGSSSADYTQAGRWSVNGSWTQMLPGPS